MYEDLEVMILLLGILGSGAMSILVKCGTDFYTLFHFMFLTNICSHGNIVKPTFFVKVYK